MEGTCISSRAITRTDTSLTTGCYTFCCAQNEAQINLNILGLTAIFNLIVTSFHWQDCRKDRNHLRKQQTVVGHFVLGRRGHPAHQ